MLYKNWILIRVVETGTYYALYIYIKGRSCYHELRYEGYLKLIYRCLLYDMYIELNRMRIPYGKITYVYGKTHIM